MPYDNGRAIWVALGPRQSLGDVWPRIEGFI